MPEAVTVMANVTTTPTQCGPTRTSERFDLPLTCTRRSWRIPCVGICSSRDTHTGRYSAPSRWLPIDPRVARASRRRLHPHPICVVRCRSADVAPGAPAAAAWAHVDWSQPSLATTQASPSCSSSAPHVRPRRALRTLVPSSSTRVCFAPGLKLLRDTGDTDKGIGMTSAKMTPMRVWHATRALSTLRVPSKRALSRSQDVVPAAIAVFRAQNGHVVVPPSFRIPHEEDAWPIELHGARLGTMLMRLYTAIKNPEYRHLREQLVAMGLPPSAVDWRQFHWRETTLAALTMYQRLHGDLYVPRSFVVPQDDAQWPRSTWGLALGRQVNTLRKKHTELPDFQRKALDQLDFPWNVMEHKWNTRFLPALRRFYALHGHSNVPQSFIVPANDPEWLNLPQCHGYRLGAAVNKVRRGDAFTAQIETSLSELDAVNFTFQSSDQHWRERVLPALETFYRLHNHCDIHAYFIVPEDSSQWPKATHGMRLGFIVQNIRSRGDFFAQIMRDGEQLEAIEFVWNRSEMKWKQVVLPALETFAALHAHTKIPVSFVVPREAPWPPESYDLRLGRIASTPSARQRFANFIEIDRQRLASIGLDWTMFPRNEDEEQEEEDTDGDTEDDLDMLFEDEDEEEDW